MQITESGGIVFNDEKGNTQYITEEELKELWNNKCKDRVVESVRSKFLNRSNTGIKKYNCTLEENNKDNYLNHLQEELMDGVAYIEKLLQQKKDIKQIVQDNPNYYDLGLAIKKLYS